MECEIRITANYLIGIPLESRINEAKVTLAFFDEEVDVNTKRKMALDLKEGQPEHLNRASLSLIIQTFFLKHLKQQNYR